MVVYGSSERSGDSEFTFWVLSYLGHKNARVLDGSLEDWIAAELPIESSENRKLAVAYKPDIKSEFLAGYDYVKSGQAQILDARPFPELSKGRIPGAVAMDTTNVLDKDMMKSGEGLKIVFERLNKVSPVVVYSDDYANAPLVWFALGLMGYNASIYTWEDWRDTRSRIRVC